MLSTLFNRRSLRAVTRFALVDEDGKVYGYVQPSQTHRGWYAKLFDDWGSDSFRPSRFWVRYAYTSSRYNASQAGVNLTELGLAA